MKCYTWKCNYFVTRKALFTVLLLVLKKVNNKNPESIFWVIVINLKKNKSKKF